jgi:hypothetical protein
MTGLGSEHPTETRTAKQSAEDCAVHPAVGKLYLRNKVNACLLLARCAPNADNPASMCDRPRRCRPTVDILAWQPVDVNFPGYTSAIEQRNYI